MSGFHSYQPSRLPSALTTLKINDISARHLRFRKFVALFDYIARTEEETCLRKRDDVVLLANKDSDWWLVHNLSSGNKGYVPSSFVAKKGSVEAEEWFMPKLSRKDSERLLLLEGNTQGVFLVRESETSQGSLTLSVRDEEHGLSGITNTVKHYRIKHPDYRYYYITTKCSFSSLQELIQFYSMDSHGLCCKLTRACLRPPPITSDLSFKTKDHWEISKSSIVLIEKLGAGQFGEVWKGIWNGTTEVAVKTLKQGTMTKEEFLKEARIMRSAQHSKLVRLYAVCTEDPIYIVTELMCNGSLLQYLRDGPGKNLQINSLVDMMAQIASGMAYLEKEHFIHRDLAARNILVGDNNCVKIADFGLARMVEDHYSTYMAQKSTKFPIKWTAPEAALMGRFTIKSDVWSFGIVIYEIITLGQVPYPSMNNTETLHQVSTGYRMPRPINCPQPIYDILLQIWDSCPEKRPTFAFLFEFFEDYFVTSDTNYKHAISASTGCDASVTTINNNKNNCEHHLVELTPVDATISSSITSINANGTHSAITKCFNGRLLLKDKLLRQGTQ
ncbi:Tyrosine-protein kinase Fyn isoform 1 [Schistosoma japonicum]|uniref:Tyrosine-protein kinase n=1 Tax=Schistosoma japonicum TaxID=6182 RepID=A0A4Z2D5D6_SCHJA|nr:Tyrosine-protein kinase Fyn isoform 1 [Schistosoma japonicum]